MTAFFDSIRRLLPDTELNVMLGMAAGGDLVVAETALALGTSVTALFLGAWKLHQSKMATREVIWQNAPPAGA